MNDVGYDVLGTRCADNGAISCQTGDAVNAEVACDDAEWWQHVGFASRPASAVQGQSSCQVLSLETTGRDICYASRDLRGRALYRSLGPGETVLYADGPNAQGTGLVHLKDDGATSTISISTRQGNVENGAVIEAKFSSTGEVQVSTGSCTVTIDGQAGKTTIQSGSCTVTIDGGTGKIELTGSQINLGGPGGFPVMIETGQFAAWIAAVSAGFAGIGVVLPPLTTFTSTTTKAT